MKCICKFCEKTFDYKRGTGRTTKHCGSCMTNRRRFQQKKKAVEFLGGKCIKCGYNRSLTALQFHHRDPSAKSFSISGNHARAWSKIIDEIKKCDLLCANCHHEIEYGIIPITTVYE